MKKIVIVVMSIIMLLPNYVMALDLAPSASSVIVIEPLTKEIIYERNSHERRHPASMTKIMTMLLVVESIEKGNLKWADIVSVSENASSMGGSQILLETNELMSVEDLFKGLAVASGNDVVVAIRKS